MSSASDAHAAHDAHAALDDHHDFDDTPIRELPADEPRTPMWMPALGVALFAAAAVAFLLSLDSPEAGAQAKVEPAAPTPAQQAPAGLPRPNTIQLAPGAMQQPGTNQGEAAIRQLSPEQIAELRKRIEEAQKRRQAAEPAPEK